ncbi:MAG: hypothetical protein A2W99_00170 [Bacteroidetes bacterium GWF2_33_16]|nr:MAG: hypothetical protein A2X00_02875 [Bacteroidetes bacterium GWE2_32_14]OFY08690.1 MAG: hypothetical protein A2W99_00170 [Bacteroidetes bacterium GWF2_33_16]
MKIYFSFFLVLSFCYINAIGQIKSGSSNADKIAKATNFSVPSSVAFNLLDVNPSQVYRPGFTKDFKLDWVYKDNNLLPNMAIETQPAWLLFYKNTDYQKLIKQNYLEKLFSSLTVSIGTAEKDSINSIAWGVKVKLYSKKDPVYDTSYINKIGNFIANRSILDKIDSLTMIIDFEQNEIKKAEYIQQRDLLSEAYKKIEKKHFDQIDKYIADYEKENWNTTMIDLGFGQVFNYLGEAIDTLKFSNKGFGVWVAGNTGVGKNILINGMIKYSEISKNQILTFGANIRYGIKDRNFFIEGVYNNYFNDNPNNFSISYGGDIVMYKSIAIQFGLRTDYSKDMKIKNLIPIVNLNYILNQ